jgi:tetratricopeptide (TPR) repeat protein
MLASAVQSGSDASEENILEPLRKLYDRVFSNGPVPCLLFGALLLGPSATVAVAQTPPPPPPKKQLPADQRAYKAAVATPDPAQRIVALQAFVKDYPKSDRAGRAKSKTFDILLKNFPDRAKEIDKAAKEEVKSGGKGLQKLENQGNVAEELSEAGPNGVDLPQADKWAKEAVEKITEPDYDKATVKMYEKFKAKPPKNADLHKDYEDTLAGVEASLADVYLHEGKMADAKDLLDKAYAQQPLDSDTNAVRGELALAQHNDAEALHDFERAELSGDLAARWRTKLADLYSAANGGSDSGMETAMDAEYKTMFPPPFTPAKASVKPGGHTVLLELFTGSACPPCVGGDLAVDGLLDSYPSTDLVALSFDEHIPEPDPLANPDTAARADMYHSHSTPNYVLDGKLLNLYGQGREKSKDLYDPMTRMVTAEAELPTSVQLKLSAARSADGQVEAHATVTTGTETELAKQIVFPPEPKPEQKPGAPKDGKVTPQKKDTKKSDKTVIAKPAVAAVAPPAAAPATPDLALNFALVEDDIRYSGENGIRFHRYVVRSLAKPADGGFPVPPGKSETLEAAFDPAAISAKLKTYLDGYAKDNDRFGPITFLSTDTAMQPSHLYVAAWVQDRKTHRVLDAAIVPVETSNASASKHSDSAENGGN